MTYFTLAPKPSPPPLKSTEGPQTRESGINYNQTLVAIVIIGIFFVVINLCIYVGIVKACVSIILFSIIDKNYRILLIIFLE